MYFINLEFIDLATAGRSLALVASVFVGFSARSRHFSRFGGAQIGASATLMEGAGREGEGRTRTFLRSPQFSCVQRAKNASSLRKTQRTRLLRRLAAPELPNQCNTIDNCRN